MEVSHYRLLELIGRGGMGEVWLAEDTQLPRKVAVKLLPSDLGGHDGAGEDAVTRLLREAQTAASIDHPAVVTVYEAGIADGRPYLVMQKLEGETLEARLKRGPLPVAEAVSLISRIADGLAEVHALGIVHRDLKPANIILSPRGPKILDFGVASLRGSPKLTATGAFVGTPLTMSPEQVRGQCVDNRSDLWALGVILYEMLTGVSPFAGDPAPLVGHRVITEQPPAPSTRRRDIGVDLDYVVMKLLRKDKAHRYARAEELLADLGSISNTHPERAASGARSVPRVAVTYFDVLSPAPDDAYLAAGLTDDLIVNLTRIGGVQVASREDVRPYRDRPVPPRTLARELGVNFVLMGSVRRARDRARISAQLVRGSDGNVLWAERFNRTALDLFDVQAEVSQRIVEALQVTLRPGEKEMLARPPTSSAEAYALYLKARDMTNTGLVENRRAEELLKRALELDPQFALAHATLGECYARRCLNWWAGLEAADQAETCVERALEMEPDLFEGHLVKAMLHRIRGQKTELLQSLARVIEMNPAHSEALRWAAWSYMAAGRPEEAVGILEQLTARGRAWAPALSSLVNCYEMLGRDEDAQRTERLATESFLEEVQRRPDDVTMRVNLGIQFIRDGRVQDGTQQIDMAIAMAPDDGRVRYNAACGFALAGMAERAIEELKEGIRNVPSYIADWPQRDPDLRSVHEHPEFVRMFGRAGAA